MTLKIKFQKCSIVFSNWIYTGDLVNLTYALDAEETMLGSYVESGEWDILGSLITRVDNYFGGTNPYPEVTFQLHLERSV